MFQVLRCAKTNGKETRLTLEHCRDIGGIRSPGYQQSACQSCRLSKTRCDRLLHSCTRCRNRGLECIYDKQTKAHKKYELKSSDKGFQSRERDDGIVHSDGASRDNLSPLNLSQVDEATSFSNQQTESNYDAYLLKDPLIGLFDESLATPSSIVDDLLDDSATNEPIMDIDRQSIIQTDINVIESSISSSQASCRLHAINCSESGTVYNVSDNFSAINPENDIERTESRNEGPTLISLPGDTLSSATSEWLREGHKTGLPESQHLNEYKSVSSDPCLCLTYTFGVIEDIELQRHKVADLSLDNILRVFNNALATCEGLLNCPSCSCHSKSVVATALVIEKLTNFKSQQNGGLFRRFSLHGSEGVNKCEQMQLAECGRVLFGVYEVTTTQERIQMANTLKQCLRQRIEKMLDLGEELAVSKGWQAQLLLLVRAKKEIITFLA